MSDKPHLRELTEKYLDGMTSQEETDELDELLQTSPEARQAFLEESHFHALLDESYGDSKESKVVKKTVRFPGSYGKWMAVAASIALAFVLGGKLRDHGTPTPGQNLAEEPHYVAQLTHYSGIKDSNFRLGQYLEQGKTLEIQEGLVELTFFNGTVATLQAPAQAKLDSLQQVSLDSGVLTIQVPNWVDGFHLQTQQAGIANPASSYGVRAFDNGAVETHVFGGTVLIQGQDGHPLAKLQQAEAYRVSNGSGKTIKYQAALFPKMRGSSGNLIPSGDFEPGVQVLSDKLPGNFHQWSGDFSRIVSGEQGITPASGRGMLRFLHTYNNDSPEGAEMRTSSSQVYHLLDLREAFPEGIQEGCKVEVSCQVNRVDAGASTDNRFSVRIMAYGKLPEDIFSYESMSDATISKTIDSDSAPGTWEPLTVGMEILPTAPILILEIAAMENVHNDIGENIELHGHYMDDLRVKITNPPSPAPVLVTSL